LFAHLAFKLKTADSLYYRTHRWLLLLQTSTEHCLVQQQLLKDSSGRVDGEIRARKKRGEGQGGIPNQICLRAPEYHVTSLQSSHLKICL